MRCRCLEQTTLPISLIRLTGQCGNFNTSQPYSSPRPVDSFTLWRRSVLPARYELDCNTATGSQYLGVNCEPIV
jgi:hypothetical protein